MKKPTALLFDTFGTVVDWRGSLARRGAALAKARNLPDIDWDAFARDWRAGYQPGMEKVRSGERSWTSVDIIHRERLDEILLTYGLGDRIDKPLRDEMTCWWHGLDPWPDSVPGLLKLKRDFLIGPLSNGSLILLATMAKRAGIPWDFVFSSDTFNAFKPQPETYLGSVRILGLEPDDVMMVAAHNDDLRAARSHGLRTAYINRPYEYGVGQTVDFGPEENWDISVDTIEELANIL